ncbi:MAG: DUF1501 domain-containing protein [Gemmataceae bacterium]|nr:DUF1501 domain-containing protein [Gemmataceae bacterium]MDW8265903.1 DUF1501 domain-containing protein [Gemmataceae bacterium]
MPALRSSCPGPIDRRTWLKVGGLSLGALVSGVEPSLARLFAADAAPRRLSKDFSVILFWANGGPSHLDLFDLKPGAPEEIRGPFKPIQTNVPGIQITEELPRLAQLADKFAIIRSLHHNRAEHSGATNRFLTGYASVAANLNDSEFPDIGSIVAKQLEGQAGDIPIYIGDTKFYGAGPAYLGPAYAPFMPSPNPLSSTGNNVYDPVPIYLTPESAKNLVLSSEGALTLRRRHQLAQTLDALPRALDRSPTMATFDSFQRRAVELLASSKMREAFDLSRESDKTRERYGHTHWGKSLLTCRRLIEAGARFVQCQASYRLRPETGRTSNWDDHSVNSHIFDAYREKLPSFDQSVSALIEDLYQRGLDKHVLFIFCGEFGRTPRIGYQDPSRRPGRDHWPRAMSVLLAGGGLKMGQVIGATNARGEEPIHRAMNSNCLLATIYHRFGIDVNHVYYDRTGRPIPILQEGEPIAELL